VSRKSVRDLTARSDSLIKERACFLGSILIRKWAPKDKQKVGAGSEWNEVEVGRGGGGKR
jgi:hypothetical protein